MRYLVKHISQNRYVHVRRSTTYTVLMHGAFNVKIQLSVYITIEQSLLVKKEN